MMVITLKELRVSMVLGVYEWEKKAKRDVILHIEMQVDADKACTSDAVDDAVDYAIIEQKLLAHLQNASYQLIEKLVSEVGKLILALDKRIMSVRVEADKPGALQHATSVSVAGIFTRNA